MPRLQELDLTLINKDAEGTYHDKSCSRGINPTSLRRVSIQRRVSYWSDHLTELQVKEENGKLCQLKWITNAPPLRISLFRMCNIQLRQILLHFYYIYFRYFESAQTFMVRISECPKFKYHEGSSSPVPTSKWHYFDCKGSHWWRGRFEHVITRRASMHFAVESRLLVTGSFYC